MCISFLSSPSSFCQTAQVQNALPHNNALLGRFKNSLGPTTNAFFFRILERISHCLGNLFLRPVLSCRESAIACLGCCALFVSLCVMLSSRSLHVLTPFFLFLCRRCRPSAKDQPTINTHTTRTRPIYRINLHLIHFESSHTYTERLTMSTMNDTPSSPPPPQQQQHLRQPQQPAKLKVRKRLARLKSTVDKSQQRMFAEHYRVDRSEKVVLPGVPKHDADWARDVHDFFNLIVLVRILYRPTHTFIPYCACGCGMDTLLFLLWSCRH